MRTLALTLLLSATLIAGSKHAFHRPVFVYQFHPDLPLSEYAKGRLGIPMPEHARIYLYAAYRFMEGESVYCAGARGLPAHVEETQRLGQRTT